MNAWNVTNIPGIQPQIAAKCKEIGFSMPSDLYIGNLLKTLITSKPHSNLLELGTGIGLSLSWMVDGMDSKSMLTTIDNDQKPYRYCQRIFRYRQQNKYYLCRRGGLDLKV